MIRLQRCISTLGIGVLLFIAGCGNIDNPESSALNEADFYRNDERFLSLAFTNARGVKLPLRLYVPETYATSRQYPLILYLHSASGRGYDNLGQITGANYLGTHTWTTPENQAKNPCFVLAPQCGEEQLWTDFDFHRDDLSPILENVLGALAKIQTQYAIDPNRLYVVGVSMGGFAVWDLICKQPNLFAAAIPVSGGGDPDLVEGICSMPLWAFNNAADPTVDIEYTRDLIETMQAAGGAPRYTEFANPDHTIEEEVFMETNLSDWLFDQSRTPIR